LIQRTTIEETKLKEEGFVDSPEYLGDKTKKASKKKFNKEADLENNQEEYHEEKNKKNSIKKGNVEFKEEELEEIQEEYHEEKTKKASNKKKNVELKEEGLEDSPEEYHRENVKKAAMKEVVDCELALDNYKGEKVNDNLLKAFNNFLGESNGFINEISPAFIRKVNHYKNLP